MASQKDAPLSEPEPSDAEVVARIAILEYHRQRGLLFPGMDERNNELHGLIDTLIAAVRPDTQRGGTGTGGVEKPIELPAVATRFAPLSEPLLEALKAVEQHCPCGARPESPNTHPHVGGCPVSDAIDLATALQSTVHRLEAENGELLLDRDQLQHAVGESNHALRQAAKQLTALSSATAEQRRQDFAAGWRAALNPLTALVGQTRAEVYAAYLASEGSQ